MSLTYKDTGQFVLEESHGRSPRVVVKGHHWADYDENIHMWVRHEGGDGFRVKVFVRNIPTTDEKMNWRQLQNYALNTFNCKITDNYKSVVTSGT